MHLIHGFVSRNKRLERMQGIGWMCARMNGAGQDALQVNGSFRVRASVHRNP